MRKSQSFCRKAPELQPGGLTCYEYPSDEIRYYECQDDWGPSMPQRNAGRARGVVEGGILLFLAGEAG